MAMLLKILYAVTALALTLPIVTPAYYRKANWPGALLCFGLAVPAAFLGQLLPVAGSAVIGMLLGMVLAAAVKRPALFEAGITDSGKRVLQGAIVLMGFQMDLSQVLGLGAKSLALVLTVIAAVLLAAWLLGRLLRVEREPHILIGVGAAICGGSAIAASAPIIKADSQQVAGAISTIFLFNVLAVFLFPLLGHVLGMSDLRFGMWAGSAITDTSSVVAAGYSFSDAAGNIATVVKLTRTLMIIPVACALALLQVRKDRAARSGNSGFSLAQTFPWFVAAFFSASVLNTLGLFPESMTAFWGRAGKFCITAAMVAIGLNTNLRALLAQGRRALLLGGCCALTAALVSLLTQGILGIS